MSNNEQAPEATEAAPPSGMKAKLPMIAMIAVGLAVGGGTGAAFIGPMFSKTVPTADASAEGDHAAAPDAAGEHGAPPTPGSASVVHNVENLVLNPAGSSGSRFLLLSVSLEPGNDKIIADLSARDAELRDIILTSLGKKTVDELTDINVRETVKAELITAISERFGKGAIKRLYFPQFVVQ